MAPEVRESREQTPKVDIWGLGVTVVECLEGLEKMQSQFQTWQRWDKDLQACLIQHQPRFTSMLDVVTDRRPMACDLLGLHNPPTNGTSSLGVSSLAIQVNGTTSVYSAAPTPMDWTQTVAAALLQGNPLPIQRNGSMQSSQPNPVVLQSPNLYPNRPNRPAQPGSKRGGSIKSTKSTERRKGHKRNGSSQRGRVPKRTSSRKRQPSAKSIHKAQEIQVLGIA